MKLNWGKKAAAYTRNEPTIIHVNILKHLPDGHWLITKYCFDCFSSPFFNQKPISQITKPIRFHFI